MSIRNMVSCKNSELITAEVHDSRCSLAFIYLLACFQVYDLDILHEGWFMSDLDRGTG